MRRFAASRRAKDKAIKEIAPTGRQTSARVRIGRFPVEYSRVLGGFPCHTHILRVFIGETDRLALASPATLLGNVREGKRPASPTEGTSSLVECSVASVAINSDCTRGIAFRSLAISSPASCASAGSLPARSPFLTSLSLSLSLSLSFSLCSPPLFSCLVGRDAADEARR